MISPFLNSRSRFFIVKAMIMNFSEDQDVDILYLSTKFELDQFTNNGDLLADRILWDRHTHTDTHRHTQTHIVTHTHTLTHTD